jgi:hypothetical protein
VACLAGARSILLSTALNGAESRADGFHPYQRLSDSDRDVANCVPLLMLLWAGIGTVSVLDTYITVLTSTELNTMEVNPIARMLMDLSPHGKLIYPAVSLQQIAVFVGFKFAGTLMVLGFLLCLYFWRQRTALAVSAGVCLFQVCLALYLTLA